MGGRKALINWAKTIERRGNTTGNCAHVAVTGILPPRYGPNLKTWLRDAELGGISSESLLIKYEQRGVVEYGAVTIGEEDPRFNNLVRESETFLNIPEAAGIVLSEPSRLVEGATHDFSIRGPIEEGKALLFDNARELPVGETTVEEALRRAAKLKDRRNVILVFKGENWPR